MTQHEFIRTFQAQLKNRGILVTLKHTEQIMQAFSNTVSNAMVQGDKVPVKNLGFFSTKTKKGRKSIYQFGPQKGQRYQSPDKLICTFTPCKPLTKKLQP